MIERESLITQQPSKLLKMDHFMPWLQTCQFHWTWNKIQISFHVLQVPTDLWLHLPPFCFFFDHLQSSQPSFCPSKNIKLCSLPRLCTCCFLFVEHSPPTSSPPAGPSYAPQLFKCLIHSHISAKKITPLQRAILITLQSYDSKSPSFYFATFPL